VLANDHLRLFEILASSVETSIIVKEDCFLLSEFLKNKAAKTTFVNPSFLLAKQNRHIVPINGKRIMPRILIITQKIYFKHDVKILLVSKWDIIFLSEYGLENNIDISYLDFYLEEFLLQPLFALEFAEIVNKILNILMDLNAGSYCQYLFFGERIVQWLQSFFDAPIAQLPDKHFYR
jgi:hypothetical protein